MIQCIIYSEPLAACGGLFCLLVANCAACGGTIRNQQTMCANDSERSSRKEPLDTCLLATKNSYHKLLHHYVSGSSEIPSRTPIRLVFNRLPLMPLVFLLATSSGKRLQANYLPALLLYARRGAWVPILPFPIKRLCFPW